MRKRAGLTQRAVAEELGISDKAVSKWERGLAAPDIVNLTRLAVLLDTDIESILSGNVYSHGTNWCGVLSLNYPEGIHSWSDLAGSPLIYMSLSYFLLTGIRDIIFVGEKEELDFVQRELAPYADMLHFLYENDIALKAGQSVVISYAPFFLYGKDLTRIIDRAMASDGPVRLENPYARNPDIPLIIFPDGADAEISISEDPDQGITFLRDHTKAMSVDRGLLSQPVFSAEDFRIAGQLMEATCSVTPDRPDDIDHILANRRERGGMAR